MNRNIPTAVKEEVLKSKYCDNKPGNYAVGCRGYECPMWKSNNGLFDESGRQIDHILEYSKGGTHDINNLQVLCPCCHAVKTLRCSRQKWDFTSEEIDTGVSHMNVDKKRKRSNSR